MSADDSTTESESAGAEVADVTDDGGSDTEVPGASAVRRSRHGLRAR